MTDVANTASTPTPKVNLIGLSREQMEAYFATIGEKKFRAQEHFFKEARRTAKAHVAAILEKLQAIDRTEAVIRRMSDIALKVPGVANVVAFPGLSINGFTNAPNAGIVFTTLKPFHERTKANESGEAIAAEMDTLRESADSHAPTLLRE